MPDDVRPATEERLACRESVERCGRLALIATLTVAAGAVVYFGVMLLLVPR